MIAKAFVFTWAMPMCPSQPTTAITALAECYQTELKRQQKNLCKQWSSKEGDSNKAENLPFPHHWTSAQERLNESPGAHMKCHVGSVRAGQDLD